MYLEYSKPFITDAALAALLGGSEDRRYSWVKRALKRGELIRLKRGFYLVGKRSQLDAFEIAQHLYGPSYISFESALSYFGWIPEAVYITTSATSKRSAYFKTPIGAFNYERIPLDQFFMGVERVDTANSTFLIATPWKALCDYYYVYRKSWKNFSDILDDLRIEANTFANEPKEGLEEICQFYNSPRVRRFARMILEAKWI